MKSVKVGVIGTNRQSHLLAIKSHERADLVAICGRNQARTAERAQTYGIRETYADYRRLIAESDLDAVVVATPDDLHYPMVMAALEKRLHVLCEKPLALNAAQAAEMLEKAKAAEVRHMVFYTWRWFPHTRHFRRLIADGAVGRCLAFSFRFLQSKNLNQERGYSWRDDHKRSYGVLGDLGSHLIDLCRYCVDEIDSVSASLSTHLPVIDPRQPVEPANDSALLTVVTHGGAQGILHASRVAAVAEMELGLSAYGERGVIELAFRESGAQIVLMRPGEPPQEVPLPEELQNELDPNKPFRQQMGRVLAEQPVGARLFVDAILGSADARPSFIDGYKTMQVIDAAIESAESGRRVSIADA
jgi:predicted dehydrogenase